MPGGFPDGALCNAVDYGSNLATSMGTAVTCSATANTKGSFAQLTASTTNDACFAIVSGAYTGTAVNYFMIDIAVGAAASEKIILPNLVLAFWPGGNANGNTVSFPIQIPAGTRLSVRCQSVAATAEVVNLNIILFDGAFVEGEGIAGYDAIGADITTSSGTLIGTSGANTKGGYIQLTASTARDYIGFLIAGQANNDHTSLNDITIGAAASEVIIIPNYLVAFSVGASPVSGLIKINIPAATRVAVRQQSDNGGSHFLILYAGYR